MATTISKLNPEWITATRQYFLNFLELTKFPHPERNGRRGSSFDYPEWKISVYCSFGSQVSGENLFGDSSDDRKVLVTDCQRA